MLRAALLTRCRLKNDGGCVEKMLILAWEDVTVIIHYRQQGAKTSFSICCHSCPPDSIRVTFALMAPVGSVLCFVLLCCVLPG